MNKAKYVYKFDNGMLMVFDEHGQQIPSLQGSYSEELMEKIKNNSDEGTEFSGFSEVIQWNENKETT